MTDINTRRDATNVQKAAAAVGVVFLLVGVLGFIPGITTNYDEMEFAGHHSGAELLGVFAVSILHNIVHLLFGVAGLMLARSYSGAKAYLIGGGVIYLVLTVYGWLVDRHDQANFVPLNDADNWLHLVLGLGMIALGLLLGRDHHDNHTTARRA
jgi:4-hydroxybenzoate polyprenyltransferase